MDRVQTLRRSHQAGEKQKSHNFLVSGFCVEFHDEGFLLLSFAGLAATYSSAS